MCCGHLSKKKLRSADTLLKSAKFLLRSCQWQIKFVRRTLVLRPRHLQKLLIALGTKRTLVGGLLCFARANREKVSVGGHLFFGHASRKNLLSLQTQKYFDQRSLDFDHLRCKKNCGRLTLLPRLRQNFSQRSILLCARQLLKRFRPGKLMLPSRQSQKFSAARKLSVGG